MSDEKLIHFLAAGPTIQPLCGVDWSADFNATNYDEDAVSCAACREILSRGRRRALDLDELPSLPREAARAAGMLLLLLARGSEATEEECDAADRELERLAVRYPDVSRELQYWYSSVT